MVADYWLSLWRIIKGNRGNSVIECGSIALMVLFLIMLLMKFTNLAGRMQNTNVVSAR